MKLTTILPKRNKYLLWPLLALAGIVLLKATLFAPPRVKTVTVSRGDLVAQVYGNGTVEAKVVVGVSSTITGRIVALYADQGDRVRRGQLLARLEPDDYSSQVRQAEATLHKTEADEQLEAASLRKARTTLEQAERDARRYRALADKNLVSRQEAEQYETARRLAHDEVARCEAAVTAARMEGAAGHAAWKTARARLADTLIYAPQDGLVVSRDLEKGAVVTPGEQIFTMTDPRTVWVKANVDETQLAGIAPGNPAAITLRSAPDTPFAGRVARLARESDRVTEELEVDVAFTPPRQEFRLGEQADVLITVGRRSGVATLPAAALAARGTARGVWTVAAGRLRFQPVRVGIEDRRGLVEVAGLTGRERIALPPPGKSATFSDGMKVRVAR